MSEKKCCCQKPEQLEGKAEDCSPQKIKECHGEITEHPCTDDRQEADNA